MLDEVLRNIKQIIRLHTDTLQKCLFYPHSSYYCHISAYGGDTLTVLSVQYNQQWACNYSSKKMLFATVFVSLNVQEK